MHASTTKPRYSLIIYWIKRLFQSNSINTFPFQVRQLLKNYDVKIFKYSTLADNFNCTVDNIVDIIGSEDGETFYLPENELYMVTYNDACLSAERRRWTLAHELGHIVLQHFQLFPYSASAMGAGLVQLSASESRLFEREADFFASELLCSPALLCQIPSLSSAEVSNIFGVSNEAATYALEKVEKNQEYYKDRVNFYSNQFHDFIQSRYCMKCHHTFTIKKSKYCPVCGSNKLVWNNRNLIIFDFLERPIVEGELAVDMKYRSYPEQENGKTEKCFRCDNEEIGDTDYCIMCGLETQNRCSNYSCGEILPLNARYCSHCGEKSNYYRLDLLPSWEDEYKEIKSELDSATKIADWTEEIPF